MQMTFECRVEPRTVDREPCSPDFAEPPSLKSADCAGRPHAQSAGMEIQSSPSFVNRLYVCWMLPFALGSAVAFSYATIMRVVEGEWSLNPLAFSLEIHPKRVLSSTFDIAIWLHVYAAFIWLGATFFQMLSAYSFADKGGFWRNAHSVVGRYITVPSMCVFLPTAIFAIFMQGRAPDVSLARFLIFDLSTNLLQAAMIVVNAFVGIHKARKKDFFTHKQLMFYSAMASLRAGADRLGIALVQLTAPDRWLGDLTLTLGSVIGTSAVLLAAVCVAWRLNALTTRVSLINILCLTVFIALDVFGCLEALGVF